MICVGQMKLPLLEFLCQQRQFVEQLISATCKLAFEVNFMTSLDRFSSQIFETSGNWGEIGELWHKLYYVCCLKFRSLTHVSYVSQVVFAFFRHFWDSWRSLLPYLLCTPFLYSKEEMLAILTQPHTLWSSYFQ